MTRLDQIRDDLAFALVPLSRERATEIQSVLNDMAAIVKAAQNYRTAEEQCDRSGEWEPAREAAVVLDRSLARLRAPQENREETT